MAINGITGSNSILPADLSSLQGLPVRRAPLEPVDVNPTPAEASATPIVNTTLQNDQQIDVPPQNVTVAAPAAAPETDAIQQNALLINEILQNLNFISDEQVNPLLISQISPTLAAADIIRDLDIIQQSALLINETLQNLNFEATRPVNPLLINQIPPDLENTDIIRNLDIIQQNALLINETLLNLGIEPPFDGTVQQQSLAVQEVAVAVEETDATLPAAAPQNVNIPVPEPEPVATTAVPAVAQPPTLPTPTVAPAVVTIPIPATFLTEGGLTPATLPVTLFPDRTPYVHVVYRLNDPAPPPGSPETINREVLPTTPVVKTLPVGDARLRQLLRGERELGKTRNLQYSSSRPTIVQAEKSIRYTLDQINSDMAIQGLPLHLVFAKHEGGLALDVYDCSYSEMCLLSYDIPISLDNLMGVLGNLDHETGIIVDTTS